MGVLLESEFVGGKPDNSQINSQNNTYIYITRYTVPVLFHFLSASADFQFQGVKYGKLAAQAGLSINAK